MEIVFEINDKTGRKIHLSKERWRHIRKKHPEVEDLDLIYETINHSDKVVCYSLDEAINYDYKFYKHRKSPERYFRVVVKYLNNTGYVVTAYFGKNIK